MTAEPPKTPAAPAPSPCAAGAGTRASGGKPDAERLARALRANLARRKAQGRARSADAAPRGGDGDDGRGA